MKKICLCFFACLSILVTAQNVTIPPSPNAASLGSFAEVPNVDFTGAVDVNIPITALRVTDRFEVPISLSYRTSGVKVDEISSSVGLGWALNAGGVITRSVQGFPDDIVVTEGKGYLNTKNRIKNFDVNNTEKYNSDELKEWEDHDRDTEPDVFYFNFLGHTGKFVFDLDGEIRSIPFSNYEFIVPQYWPAVSGIPEFIIKDDNGNSYYFSDVEATTVTTTYDNFVFFSKYQTTKTYTFNSAWYLSKVVLATGQEVDFEYSTRTISYRKKPIEIGTICKWDDCAASPPVDPNRYGPKYTDYTVTQKDISFINTGGMGLGHETVNFHYSGVTRLDLNNGSILEEIQKTSSHYLPSEDNTGKWVFYHSYFNSAGGSAEKFKRLKLLKVTRAAHITGIHPLQDYYDFEYYEDHILPERESYAQDFWGYYNGAHANQTLIPQLYVYPDRDLEAHSGYSVYPISSETREHIFGGANRLPIFPYSRACTLKKIIYPTKGSQTFTYEGNDFMYENSMRPGPGLRIKEITKKDGQNPTKDLTYSYDYYSGTGNPANTNGRLFYLPIFAINNKDFNIAYWHSSYIRVEHYHWFYSSYEDDTYPQTPWTDYWDQFYSTSRFAADQSSLGVYGGAVLGYSSIRKTFPDGGYEVKQFNTEGSMDTWGAMALGVYANTGDFYIPKTICYAPPNSADQNSANLFYRSKYVYPFGNVSNYDWKRGKIENIMNYDDQFKLVSQEAFDYQVNDYGSEVEVMKVRPLYRYDDLLVPGQIPNGNWDLVHYAVSFYKIHTDLKFDMVRQTSKIYNGTDIREEQTDFAYDNLLPYPRETRLQLSNGFQKVTRHRYLQDIRSSIGPSDLYYSDLLEKNALSWPLETTTLLDKWGSRYVLSSAAFKYNSSTLTSKSFIETNSPISEGNFNYLSYSGGNISLDSRYTSTLEMRRNTASNGGNGIVRNVYEVRNDGTVTEQYIWNEDFGFLEAVINGAEGVVCFYLNFDWYSSSWNQAFFNNAYSSANQSGGETNDQDDNLSLKLIPSESELNFPVTSSATYIVNFWAKDGSVTVNGISSQLVFDRGDGWANYEVEVSSTSNLNIVGSTFIDELRIHPKGAMMKTFRHRPRNGVVSITDERGQTTSYDYDEYGRLQYTRDLFNNYSKELEYNYR